MCLSTDDHPEMQPKRPSSRTRLRLPSAEKLRTKSPVLVINKPIRNREKSSSSDKGRRSPSSRENEGTGHGDPSGFENNKASPPGTSGACLICSCGQAGFNCSCKSARSSEADFNRTGSEAGMHQRDEVTFTLSADPTNNQPNYPILNIQTPVSNEIDQTLNGSSITSTDNTTESSNTDSFVKALNKLPGPAHSADTLRFNSKDTLKKRVVINESCEVIRSQRHNNTSVDRKTVTSQEDEIRLRYDDMMRHHHSTIGCGVQPITWTTSSLSPKTRTACKDPIASLDVITPSFGVISPLHSPQPIVTLPGTDAVRTSCQVIAQQRLATFCSNPIPKKEGPEKTDLSSFKPVDKEPDQDYPIEFFLEPEQRITGLQLCECNSDAEIEDNKCTDYIDPTQQQALDYISDDHCPE